MNTYDKIKETADEWGLSETTVKGYGLSYFDTTKQPKKRLVELCIAAGKITPPERVIEQCEYRQVEKYIRAILTDLQVTHNA